MQFCRSVDLAALGTKISIDNSACDIGRNTKLELVDIDRKPISLLAVDNPQMVEDKLRIHH